jgi:hypothetical protein
MTMAPEIMTPEITCVGENETLADAARALPDRPVGDLIDAISV